ncbi:hypothetical protein T484DRAFT_1979606 [Baffinella frigidus]|nr:hypothetical protein T484DRAFT_1979606 [Cryptophyta sp. CCMP2293]
MLSQISVGLGAILFCTCRVLKRFDLCQKSFLRWNLSRAPMESLARWQVASDHQPSRKDQTVNFRPFSKSCFCTEAQGQLLPAPLIWGVWQGKSEV